MTAAAVWPPELRRRLISAWVSKMLATTLGISAFFVAYFWVLHFPQETVTTMPLTALDRLVPIAPQALPLYLSLWVYVSIGPALLRDGRDLAAYGAATFVLSAAGLGIFLLWPTMTPDFGVDWSRYPSMAFLKRVDVTANACPSLHVAFAVFTGIRLDRLLRDIGLGRTLQALSVLWCAGIVYSTVAVRQHVVLDVAAGAALGAVIAWTSLRVEGAWDAASRRLSGGSSPRDRLAYRPIPAPVAAPLIAPFSSPLEANRGGRPGARRRSPGPAGMRPALPPADPAASAAAPFRTDRGAGPERNG